MKKDFYERDVIHIVDEFKFETSPGTVETIVIGHYTPRGSDITKWWVCGEDKVYLRTSVTKYFRPTMSQEGIAKELRLAFESHIILGVK